MCLMKRDAFNNNNNDIKMKSEDAHLFCCYCKFQAISLPDHKIKLS